MKNDLSGILAINWYLIQCKSDPRRVGFIRRYLVHKLAKAIMKKRTGRRRSVLGLPILIF